MIVVSRIYLSKNKYPNLKKDERIISSPEIEIPTTNLGQKSLETYAAKSIQELIEAIMTEKYISGFMNPESYNDWKRTNLPAVVFFNLNLLCKI